MRFVVLLLSLAGLCAALGCGSERGAVEAERRRFEARARAELDSLDARIGTLRVRVARLDKAVRRDVERRFPALERRRDEVRQEMAELGRAGTAAWKKARPGVERGLADLDSLWQRAKELAPEP